MKSKRFFILLALCALLTFSACQSAQAPDPAPAEPVPEVTEPEAPAPEPEPETPTLDPNLSQRELDMIEDIEYLRETYKEKHIAPFLACSEEEFDFRLDQVKAKVSELSDEDFFYELKAVLAGMGDIHTKINPSKELSAKIYGRRFPIRVQCIGDKLYLSRYLEGYEQFAPYLLREVVAVNGIDVTYLEKKMESSKNPFNYWDSKEFWSQSFLYPAFLDWAGCDYKEGYTFQILNDNQEVESVEVPAIPSTEADEGTWIYPEDWENVMFGWSEDGAEYIDGENGGCIYVHYSNLASSASIMKTFDAAGKLIEEHPDCGKLVVDMRDHSGGDPDKVPQVQESAKQLAAPTIKQTYVVTGGFSASGAIPCLKIFRDTLNNVVVIGEPTAQFDSFLWSSTAVFTLPHSKHYGRISDSWYESGTGVETYYDEDGKLYPWESTILPDVYIHQDIEDVRQGKDSVIEWVLAQ